MMKQGYRETCVHTKFAVNVEITTLSHSIKHQDKRRRKESRLLWEGRKARFTDLSTFKKAQPFSGDGNPRAHHRGNKRRAIQTNGY